MVLDHAVRGRRISAAAALTAGLRRAPGLAGVYLVGLLLVVLVVAVGVLPIILIATSGTQVSVPGGLAAMLFAWGAAVYACCSLHVSLISPGLSVGRRAEARRC